MQQKFALFRIVFNGEAEFSFRRFNAIVSQLKISLFWVIYIIQKPRYCCVGRKKLVILHALFGN